MNPSTRVCTTTINKVPTQERYSNLFSIKSMLGFQIQPSNSSTASLLHLHKPFPFSGRNYSSKLKIRPPRRTVFRCKLKNENPVRSVGPVVSSLTNMTQIKGVITIKKTVVSSLSLGGVFNNIKDFLHKSMLVELVSSEDDPETGTEKETVTAYANRGKEEANEVKYECKFNVPQNFGEIGGVVVENQHHNEMLLKDIVLSGFPNGSTLTIPCNSWVHSKFDNPDKRIFFTTKSYLPMDTPNGLKKRREEELKKLRGNGEGERKSFERIYDYDFYNDLGNPDVNDELDRPVLGGPNHPYPRRCRTGRGPSQKDPLTEKKGATVYVPRDEKFSEEKQLSFTVRTLSSGLNALPSVLESLARIDMNLSFKNFTEINSLFKDGITLLKQGENGEKRSRGFSLSNVGSVLGSVLKQLVKVVATQGDQLLIFETPQLLDRDTFSWLKDEEFARQTLAGTNPYSIQLVKEWPLQSNLDPETYGPPDSLITTKLVESHIQGTIAQAMEEKKLFILDYHDTFLPYVNKVRAIKGTTLYGSRTLFFLTEEGTLKPIAIELTRPPDGDKPQWKEVFTPSNSSATSLWLWRLAKAHVAAHDSGYHELVSHWLRTHCCMEPYIIATHRQLSEMHPIYRLLHPHCRYTMNINALARQYLINGGGIIEIAFSPSKYSMELSSVFYDKQWRFDMEGLPADLIRRGMAVEDPMAEHGLKLTIEDYPFANDGLILWDVIKTWVGDYVNHYYPNSDLVEGDPELQEWWTEIRTKGHGDKKDEPWWPVLKTQNDLISILTTIIWVASAHHSAVNFAQYAYAGYFPNRPSIARTNMPVEDPTEENFKKFLENPESTLIECLPSQVQATVVMATIDVLSDHSPEEEYIGGQLEPAWADDPTVKEAFQRFSEKLKDLERTIDGRNVDEKLKNRTGAGVVPYELLKPFSNPGVTGMGVPNSTSI